jgi:hypothetical protein
MRAHQSGSSGSSDCSGSSGFRERFPPARYLVARWGVAAVLAGTAMAGGCWLDRGIVDVPTVQDAAPPPPQDAGLPGTGGCQWPAASKSGCGLTSVSCNQLNACPPSWMQANSPGSCPKAGATLSTETCEGMYRWSLASSDGTLIGVCYYDMAGGLLAGIDWQAALPCGSSTASNQFGTIPQACHYDAGVVVQRFTCAAAGSGDLTDGGFTQSCSQEMPCHGGG